MKLANLPSKCVCGEIFSVDHALICKKGGFISKRHDNIRDLLTVLLNKVCVDVQSEPHLIPIKTEKFNLRSANTNDDSRLDVKARGFWTRDQTAFFDIRVTHVGSQSNKNRDTNTVFRQHELETKRQYMQRVLDVEQGSFTPLVFGTNGGMGDECRKFVDELSRKLPEKKNEEYRQVVTWLRIRLSMEVTIHNFMRERVSNPIPTKL